MIGGCFQHKKGPVRAVSEGTSDFSYVSKMRRQLALLDANQMHAVMLHCLKSSFITEASSSLKLYYLGCFSTDEYVLPSKLYCWRRSINEEALLPKKSFIAEEVLFLKELYNWWSAITEKEKASLLNNLYYWRSFTAEEVLLPKKHDYWTKFIAKEALLLRKIYRRRSMIAEEALLLKIIPEETFLLKKIYY